MKSLSFSIILLLLLLNSFLAIRVRVRNNEAKNLKYEVYNLNEKIVQLDIFNYLLLDGITKNLEYNFVKLDKNLELQNKGDSLLLSELNIIRPKLVLRYSELNCNVCVDSQFETLNRVTKQIGEENILIFGSYSKLDDLNRFKRINNIHLEIYNLKNIGLSIDDENIPYYFVLDSSLVVKDLFIPKDEYPDLTKSFFELISKKYFLIK